jgi:hypothetical protein
MSSIALATSKTAKINPAILQRARSTRSIITALDIACALLRFGISRRVVP